MNQCDIVVDSRFDHSRARRSSSGGHASGIGCEGVMSMLQGCCHWSIGRPEVGLFGEARKWGRDDSWAGEIDFWNDHAPAAREASDNKV